MRPSPVELARCIAKHGHAVLEMHIAGLELHRVGANTLQLRQSFWRQIAIGWRGRGTGRNKETGSNRRREINNSYRSGRGLLHDNEL